MKPWEQKIGVSINIYVMLAYIILELYNIHVKTNLIQSTPVEYKVKFTMI